MAGRRGRSRCSLAAHLPPDAGDAGASRLVLGGVMRGPWPGAVRRATGGDGARLARLNRPAALGELAAPLAAGPLDLWDERTRRDLTLDGGHLAPT